MRGCPDRDHRSPADGAQLPDEEQLAGADPTDEACAKLAENQGMIASFSRGLLQDLRHHQSDEEFDSTLGKAIDQIHLASVR